MANAQHWVAAAVAGVLGAGLAGAPALAGEPRPEEYRIDTLTSCQFDNSTFDFVTVGQVTSKIASVRAANSRWYQRITMEIDHWNGGWEKVDRKTRDHQSFTSAHVPTSSKDAVRTHFADGGQVRLKVVVKLRKVRNNAPDKTEWTKEFAARAVTCGGIAPGSG